MPLHCDLLVERLTTNKLNDKKLKEQVVEISEAANKRSSTPGIVGTASEVTGPVEIADEETGKIQYKYVFRVHLKKENYRSEAAAQKMLDKAKILVQRVAEQRQWKFIGDEKDAQDKAAAILLRPKMDVPAEIDATIIADDFDGVYERDAHIRIIHSHTVTAIETDFEERNHILLYGPPAACKSMIFKKFKDFYEKTESGIERVAIINATTLSKAGLENWILEKARDGLLPEILFFDEIEKFNPDNLFCLWQIMDGQGKISKMNAKIGKQEENAKILVWATCNDLEKLKNFERGSLFSRFSKALPCVRPSRELMHKILIDKLNERRRRGRKADNRWADAAIKYAFDVMKNNDPRKIISLLAGGDRLLDGSYFRDLEAIDKAYLFAVNAGEPG